MDRETKATQGGARFWPGIIGIWALVFASGCSLHKAAPVFPRVWATGPSDRVAAQEPARDETAYFKASEDVIHVVGAVNETIGFEVVLSAIGQPAAVLEIGAEDFVSSATTIDKTAVRIHRYRSIEIERYPNWYLRTQGLREPRAIPDALARVGGEASDSPDNGSSITVLAGSNLSLYVELTIPRDARPDLYHSALVLDYGSGRRQRTPIELVVRDIYLSPEDSIPVLAHVELGPLIAATTELDSRNIPAALMDDGARRAIGRAFSILHEHGLSPYTSDVRPRLSQGSDGGVALDWDVYDDFCGPLIDGTAYADQKPAYAWPLPIDVHQPDPAQYGGLSSTAYRAALQDYISQVRAHFDSKGWLARGFIDFDFPPENSPSPERYEQFRKLAATAHGIDRRLPLLSRMIPQPMSPFGWFGHRYEDLGDAVDIWSTPSRFEHAATLASLRAHEKRTWMLPDRPPYSGSLAVEAPPVQSRSLPWQAFLRGHEAIVVSHSTDWPATLFDAPIADRDAPSDSWLLYPGRCFGVEGLVPSVRLKQLQIGLQEYQYLRLLDRYGRGETARLLAGSLIQACGTDAYGDNFQDGVTGRRVNDPEIWEQARSLLSQETEIALAEGRETSVDRSVNLTGWAKFLGATRRLEGWVESARIAIDPRVRKTRYVVTFDVAIRSSLRTGVAGELRFENLPAGAQAIGGPIHLGPIEEWGLVKRSLAYETSALPIRDLDGHFSQSIVFDAGTSGRTIIEGVVSAAEPVKAAGAILMDGRLNEWGPGELNVAGDFRIIGDQPAAVRPRAEQQTVAYFCRAGGMLYLGVRAATPGAGAIDGSAARRNVVDYEDLRPVGEDLVEILIDPSGSGTLSDDLYHVIIKSTGDPIFERGVGVSPPIGRVETWEGKRPDYAVSAGDGGWTAEIAIPLSALGPRAARSRVWGINLARLEPQRGEYSDWARAPRYCYDPRSLGNLIWPE